MKKTKTKTKKTKVKEHIPKKLETDDLSEEQVICLKEIQKKDFQKTFLNLI